VADDVARRAAEEDLAEPAAAFDADHDRLRVVLERDTQDRLGDRDLDVLGARPSTSKPASRASAAPRSAIRCAAS
jgi:hypothetical protein